jgi:dTDP-4-amino-4,6-dideoxygalactose transaminase
MPEPDGCRGNRWLTVIRIDPAAFGADTHAVREALETENIEARPVWKPMHLQPVFQGAKLWTAANEAVSDRLFEQGLCLPSGTAMTDGDLDRVCGIIRSISACWEGRLTVAGRTGSVRTSWFANVRISHWNGRGGPCRTGS